MEVTETKDGRPAPCAVIVEKQMKDARPAPYAVIVEKQMKVHSAIFAGAATYI